MTSSCLVKNRRHVHLVRNSSETRRGYSFCRSALATHDILYSVLADLALTFRNGNHDGKLQGVSTEDEAALQMFMAP